VEPNLDQHRAIDGIAEFFLNSKGGESKTLAGSAGTGKTFCMRKVREIVEEDQGVDIVFTAPTNKATKVLRQATGAECQTTFSLLGLQLLPSGEIKELKQRDRELPIADYRAVVVDEGSMVSRVLKEYLDRASRKYKVPIVYLGDRCQLPPVGEETSPLWESPIDYELTKVMRFDNQILKLATRLRGYVDFPIGNLELRDDNDNIEGVWRCSMAETVRRAKVQAAAGRFQSGECKAIAWRNREVDFLNTSLREAIGTQDLKLPFSTGDRVVARSPCMGKDKDIILHTDDECLVKNTILANHPMFPEYECFILDLETESKRAASVWCVTSQSKVFLDAALKRMADDAHKNPKNWRKFWELKEAFHDVALAYAITAHRSQGSTYEEVYVNFADILGNRNRTEAAKCLYVAASRPSKKLILGG
jgi:ATP-dependent exoDNAse (exonuclease V) alpha subunit